MEQSSSSPLLSVELEQQQSYYDGSRTFVWLADICGLSVDLLNFLICQISALFLASLFRTILHPTKVSSAIRHIFGLCVGLIFGYFIFGQQAIHIAGLPTICYIVIRTQSPAFVQRSVLIVAMLYLLSIHLHRQIYDYGSSTLDITGPLMIITQKVTSLAFSIHDGFIKEQEHMTKAQKYHAVYKIPSPLEFFSYALHFQSLIAGPLVFYKDYIEYIEGYNFLKNPPPNDKKEIKDAIYEPSPVKIVIRKSIASAICAFIFMKFVTIYPVKIAKEDEFINNTSFLYKLWYAMIATTVMRFKYYHAWLLSDAICNNSGLGFAGYEKDGSAKWDLVTNIHVLSFEFATNMRDGINSWNVGTNIWLRSIVYERVPKSYGTLLTFALSAMWHGFYPGYYLTFATGALFVTAARVARRLFRHRFQKTPKSRMFYDVVTCLTTRAAMGYACFPFVLLEFMGSLRVYLNLYMCLHLIGFLTIFLLPKFIREEKRSAAKIADSEISRLEERSNEPNNHAEKQSKKNLKNGTNAVSLKRDECEMNNFSNILREKFELETKNIEEFFDKTVNGTVTGIKKFKDHLMRENAGDLYLNSDDARKRAKSGDKAERVDVFLKKEIDVINANMIPVMIGNGHAK